MAALLILVIVAALLALGYAAFNFIGVKKLDEGTDRMSEIAEAIRVGANAFITYEYKIIGIVVVIIAIIFAAIFSVQYGKFSWEPSVCFIIGVVMSASAGWVGMKIATYANVRVSNTARKTKNIRADIVNQLGKERLEKIYDLADVYHCDNIERVSDDFIEEAQIGIGTFDNVGECKYSIPSHWDIGKVYKRLIKQVAKYENISIIDALIKVYNSFISTKIDDYNSSVYYENPSCIFESYKENKML